LRVLALDTALGASSVALYDSGEDRLLAARSEAMERGHAEALMPMVEAVLGEAGADFATIDRFAVTIGPGSFTGIRIGIAAARGFALLHAKPVVGVSTLAAFAAPMLFGADRRPAAASVDARHGMVFFQAFALGGRTIAGPGLFPIEEAARKTGDGPVAFVGNAAERLAGAQRGLSPEFRLGLVVNSAAPEIAWVARLGAVADPASAPARPLYLREANVTVQDRARLQRA